MAGFINFLLWIYSLFFTDLLATKKTPDRRFDVIWNVPSEKCYTRYGVDLPLSEFNIRSNRNQSFSGDLVTLFNEPTPGLYPHFLPNGTAQNGGLPQLVNHTKHLMKTKLDIINKISDNSFNGFAVIDWEGWVPIFDRNEYSYTRSIYINKSEDLVSELHPEWNPSRVKLEARIQFETSARKLMQETLEYATQLRPKGHWGFYGFPRCYNYKKGQKRCPTNDMEYNNELCWLFTRSSSILPSIYLPEKFGSDEDKRIKVSGIIAEAKRMKTKCSKKTTPVLAYSRYRYRDTENFYSKADLMNTIQQSYDTGLDGVILWDTSNNFADESDCINLKSYLLNVLGPFVKNLTRTYN